MFNLFKFVKSVLGSRESSSPRQKPQRALPQVEVLEDRYCPAGMWMWQGLAGVSNTWSNATGAGWLLNGNPAGPGQYPGMPGSLGDVVGITGLLSGPLTLDVNINPLNSLYLWDWPNHLTLNQSLMVTGGNGRFVFNSNVTNIDIAANKTLSLLDLGGNFQFQNTNEWDAGNIIGGEGSSFIVTGTNLQVQSTPGRLGTNLFILGSVNGQNAWVTLANMTDNLVLTGAANYIDIGNGATLNLPQDIGNNQEPDSVGGIELVPGHTAPLAVKVESGGTLYRFGLSPPGSPLNSVRIGGAVYNVGGTVRVLAGVLHITGVDANGYSYWQNTSANAVLQVDTFGAALHGTISAAGI